MKPCSRDPQINDIKRTLTPHTTSLSTFGMASQALRTEPTPPGRSTTLTLHSDMDYKMPMDPSFQPAKELSWNGLRPLGTKASSSKPSKPTSAISDHSMLRPTSHLRALSTPLSSVSSKESNTITARKTASHVTRSLPTSSAPLLPPSTLRQTTTTQLTTPHSKSPSPAFFAAENSLSTAGRNSTLKSTYPANAPPSSHLLTCQLTSNSLCRL